MWINITKDTFDNSKFKSVNYLYQIISYKPEINQKPRYNIVIDVEKVKNSSNFQLLKTIEPSLEEFLEAEFNVYANGSDIPYQITSKKGKHNFNEEEAIIFLSQPVSVVLENNKNDAAFILAIIKHFGNNDEYNKPQEHIDNGWLVFENAGGCGNIPNFLEGFLNKFKALAKKNNRNIFDYFRGIIIVDSDKEYSIQPIKDEHKSLLKKIEALNFEVSNIINESTGEIINNNIKFHILEKRMMENYLPKEVFEEIKRQIDRLSIQDLKDWLDVYLTLKNNEQLDFINIPNGFPPSENKFANENRKSIPAEILNLFKLQISDTNFKKLDKGFGFKGFDDNGNLKSSKEGSFKNEMPKWFQKELITKKNLKERAGNDELERIVSKINQLL
jgi:hypothetical protein